MIINLKRYIETELLEPSAGVSLDEKDDLLVVGMLTSLQFMRLIEHIESSLEISIPPEDMILENFQSIRKISQYLKNIHGVI